MPRHVANVSEGAVEIASPACTGPSRLSAKLYKTQTAVADEHSLSRRAFLFGAASLCLARPEQDSARQKSQALPGERIAAIQTRLGGRLGVAALDTGTKERLGYRAAERFPMCSTFKFLLVAKILSLADAKKVDLGRVIPYTRADLLDYAPITRAHLTDGGMSIEALCSAAIQYSDNTAANLLLSATGGPHGVTLYARTLGDHVTRLDRTEPTLNTAIPGDPRDTTSPKAMLQDMQRILVEPNALSGVKEPFTGLARGRHDRKELLASRSTHRLARGRQSRHGQEWLEK